MTKYRLTAPINLDYSYRNIENSLDNELYNNAKDALSTHKININTTPSFNYNIESFKFDISAKIFYQPLNIGGKWHNIFGVNPRASINWIISPRFKLSGSGGYSKGVPDESSFFNGYIMSNYRNLNLGYLNTNSGHSSNVSLGTEYKDVLKSTFANINGSYSKGKHKRVTAQYFEGDYIINYFIPGEQSYQTIMVYGSMGVGVDAINGTITLSPSFRKNISTILRNGDYLPYDSEVYSLRLLFSSNIRHNLSLSYNGNIGFSRYRSDSETNFSNITNLTQKVNLSYSPIKKVRFSYGFEYYMNELQTNNFKHFFFSDVSVSYFIGSRWEVSCSVKNLFNEKYYSSFTESDLSSLYRSYKIRPRNILLDVTYRF